MIKLLFYSLIFLVATVYLALIAKEDPGYALLSHGDWSIEGTLVLLLTVLSLLIAIVLSALYLIIKTIRLPGKVSRWNHNRKTLNAIKNCNKGIFN